MLPSIFSIGPIVIRTFSLVLILTFIACTFIFWRKAKEEHYDENEIFDMALLSIFWGIIGARLSYILLNISDFGINVVYWFSMWSKPGLHWFGLLAAGLVFVVYYSSKNKWDVLETLDISVISVSLAHALLNMGLFLNGGSIGKQTNLPIGMTFPNTFDTRHPLGLYGFLLWTLLFVFLFWVEGKYRRFEWYQRFKGDARPGFLFFVYLIGLGFIGLLLTLLSESSNVILGLDINIMLRVSILLVGIFGLITRSGIGARLGIDDLFSFERKRK